MLVPLSSLQKQSLKSQLMLNLEHDSCWKARETSLLNMY